MGPLPRKSTNINTFEYDENEDFYLCKKCETHISLLSHLRKKFGDSQNNKHYLLFEDLINVLPDVDYVFANTNTTVRSTYCTKCYADFGFKFIKLEKPKDEIQAGRSIVFADKLLVWRGKKVLHAVTEQPVENFQGGVIGEPAPVHFPDGANEKPVENETDADVIKELDEKKLQLLHISEQLKLLFEWTKYQGEITLLDGVTVEKNMPEAAT